MAGDRKKRGANRGGVDRRRARPPQRAPEPSRPSRPAAPALELRLDYSWGELRLDRDEGDGDEGDGDGGLAPGKQALVETEQRRLPLPQVGQAGDEMDRQASGGSFRREEQVDVWLGRSSAAGTDRDVSHGDSERASEDQRLAVQRRSDGEAPTGDGAAAAQIASDGVAAADERPSKLRLP